MLKYFARKELSLNTLMWYNFCISILGHQPWRLLSHEISSWKDPRNVFVLNLHACMFDNPTSNSSLNVCYFNLPYAFCKYFLYNLWHKVDTFRLLPVELNTFSWLEQWDMGPDGSYEVIPNLDVSGKRYCNFGKMEFINRIKDQQAPLRKV